VVAYKKIEKKVKHMKKILSVVLLVILMLSFVGCTDSVKGTYTGGDFDAIIIEDDIVTLVDYGEAEYFNWEKSGDYIHLTPKEDDNIFKVYKLKIVDGGVIYHCQNIESGNETYLFYEKVK
jgi:hypothetical protein